MRDRKPIPRNQSEVVQSTINPYLNQGKPVSQNVFTHRDNRALNTTRKTDNVKDFSIGLEDIDYAIKYYFETAVLPTVVQDGNRMAVPVIYGSPERWKSVQADGYYRDTNGKLVVPLIMYKRTNIEKNKNLGNKIDGNLAALFQTFETRYNQRNQYDKFSILNNRIPSKQIYVSVVPDYVTVTYECIIFTNFVEQNNSIIESIEFAADSYWGDKSRYQFRTMIDSFATTNVISTGEDRVATTNVTLKVNGYLLPDTINQHLSDTNMHYSPAQIIFTMETSDSSETFAANSKPAAPKTAMGGASISDSYNVNVTTQISTTIDTSVLTYMETSKTKYAVSFTNNTATFNASFLTAPSPLPATSVSNFTFFLNGQLIDASSIVSFIDNGDGTCTLTIDPVQLGAGGSPINFGSEGGVADQIIAIGKFA
jgi:hypothetical protein